MYFNFDPEPDPNFIDEYAEFLGIELAVRDTARDDLVDVSTACQQHLFLDPDTGLWNGQGRPRNRWRKHIGMEDLAKIAKAPGRERKLTLVFDQSYEQNIDIEERKFLAEWKLQILWLDHQIHGVAYVSHVVFIWVSKDEDLLDKATRRLLDRSRVPLCRFLDDGCGRNHIGV